MSVEDEDPTALDALSAMDATEVIEAAFEMAELIPVLDAERELWEKRARELGWKEPE